ncbi:uncharacterized protein V1510DRAFT_416276 [Dipodascopsis tothii]|uniref:uncharacterized protein n=1 Tax=Dipodascopsis tothii TaxID=44089 RepID=UPI0034CF0552
MVFKSFASIARHTTLAKNLFVASTATTPQPAFFVSTQQLARQQAPSQVQIATRGFQSFGANPSKSSANPNSSQGASFPSYGTYNPASIVASTDDERKRAKTRSSLREIELLPPTAFLQLTAAEDAETHVQLKSLSPKSPSAELAPRDEDVLDESLLSEGEALSASATESDAVSEAALDEAAEEHQAAAGDVEFLSNVDEAQSALAEPEPARPVVPELAEVFTTDKDERSRNIDRQFASKNYSGVIDSYESMKSNRVVPSKQSYNQILMSIVNGGIDAKQNRVPYLLDAYADMLSHQIIPDSITYSTVIVALVTRYINVKQALTNDYSSVLARNNAGALSQDVMAHVASLESDPSFDIAVELFFASMSTRPQSYTINFYNALLHACALAGRVETAVKVTALMESDMVQKAYAVKFNVQTYVYLIQLYGKAGNIDAMLEVYDDYKANCDALDESGHLAIYDTLIRAYFASNDSAGAVSFFNKVLDQEQGGALSEEVVILYEAVIEGFAKNGEYATGWKWATTFMAEHGTERLSAKCMADLLSAASLAKDLAAADEMYAALVALPQFDARFWSARCDYLSAYTATADVEKVLAIMQEAADRLVSIEIHTERQTALFLIEHGHHEAAVDLLKFQVSMNAPFAANNSLALNVVYECVLKMRARAELSVDTITSLLETIQALEPDFGKTDANITMMLLESTWIAIEQNGALTGVSDGAIESLLFYHAELASFNARRSLKVAADRSKPLAYYLTTLAEIYMGRSMAASEMYQAAIYDGLVKSGNMENAEAWAQFHEREAEPEAAPMPFPEFAMAAEPVMFPEFLPEPVPMPMPLMNVFVNKELSNQVAEMINVGAPSARVLDELRAALAFGNSFVSADVVAKVVVFMAAKKNVAALDEIYEMAVRALPVVDEMSLAGWRGIYNAMIVAYTPVNLRTAMYHKEKLYELGGAPNSSMFANFILNLKASGSHDEATEAINLFNEARAHSVMPTTFLYNALLSKLSKARRVKEAMMYFVEMDTLGVRRTSVTYGTMISACCRAGNEANAELLFEEMEAASSYSPRVAPFNTMLQFYVTHKRDRARALHYYRKLRALKLTPSAHTYKLLIDAYATLEPVDLASADNVLNTIAADGQAVTPQHYAALIHARGCVLHDLPAARAFLDRAIAQKLTQPDEAVFQAMIESYIANQDVAGTDEIVRMMKQRFKVMVTPYMANTLIRGWSTLDIGKARAFFDDVLVRGQSEPSTFEAMIRAYIAVDERALALDVFHMMEVQGYPEPVVARARDLFVCETELGN